MNILNQFSYPLIGLGAVILTVLILRGLLGARWRWVIAINATIILIFVGGFLLLRTGEGDRVGDVTDFRALLANRRPTFVEFFSNYCTGCLLLRPTVDAIVADIGDEYNVLRIDIHSPEGRAIRQAYDFSFTPEFVIFDQAGQEIWRDHVPPTAETLDRGLSSTSTVGG
jgi:thiol-disulfide isomerase/thioredoxin